MLVRSIVLLAVVVALPAAVWGQGQDPRETQAQRDCVSGRPDSGVALLAELYAITGNPDFIYNQARCYEAASRFDEAINRFREYLRSAKSITPEDRADAEKHIEDCRVLQARQEQERERMAAAARAPAPAAIAPVAPGYPAAPGYAPVPAFAPVAPPAAASPPAGLDVSAQPKAAESTPIYETWWFWTGVVAVVGGGVTAYFLATRHTTENACAGASIPCVATK